MGYITYHRLSVPAGQEHLIEELREENEEARWCLDSDGSTRDGGKWYKSEEDMKVFSLKHLDVLFLLEGEGEESGDIWKEWFKNGKSQYTKATMVFDEFDESKLK